MADFFIPSLRGSVDPFEKRSWIYSQIGNFRMIRDWHHLLDNRDAFHDMNKDPCSNIKSTLWIKLLQAAATGSR